MNTEQLAELKAEVDRAWDRFNTSSQEGRSDRAAKYKELQERYENEVRKGTEKGN